MVGGSIINLLYPSYLYEIFIHIRQHFALSMHQTILHNKEEAF